MTDDSPGSHGRGPRRLYLRRASSSRAAGGEDGLTSPQNNLILRQLQGLRSENKEFLERHVRDRELLTRLAERMELGFEHIRTDIKELRREVNDLRSDIVLLENKILNGQNEILDIVRRIDAAEEAEAFELVELDDDVAAPR